MIVRNTLRTLCAASQLSSECTSSSSSSELLLEPRKLSSPLPLINSELINVKRTRELLFKPITIGKFIHLSNRFVMQPMYLNLESELDPWSDKYMAALTTFYAERAHNGVELMIVGGMGISGGLGKWKHEALVLNSLHKAHALRRLTSAIHKEGGYILAQAFHPGRASWQKLAISSYSTSWNIESKARWHTFRIPACMMSWIVAQYARFAHLAEEAGFDGVEIPISEGSLLHDFLSSSTNHRNDAFGGKLVNRLELILRVLEEVKRTVQSPDHFVISARLCVHDLKVNGNHMNEILITAEALASSDYVDLLNTSVGMSDSPVQTLSSYVPQGTFARSCKLVRDYLREKQLTIPVIASHRIHSPAVAERLMEHETCDLIGLARPLLADPQFVQKLHDNDEEHILPCIGCNQCVSRLYRHERVTCALNPISGFELEKEWRPASHQKSVAVIGAGPAGLTCALTLWRRGHDVHLFERAGVIGGNLNLAKMIPGKESFQAILEYWTRQLQESTIDVHLNTEFTHHDVTRNHQTFNALVLATGSFSRPLTSSVMMGASECKLLVPFESILTGKAQAGRRVAVLGMGGNAIDVASYLLHDQRVSRNVHEYLNEWGVNLETAQLASEAEQQIARNNRDVIVLLQQNVDPDLSRGWGWAQKLWIRRHGGTIMKTAGVAQLEKDGLTIMVDYPWNKTYNFKCDTIVAAMGQLPNVKLGNWIHEWCHNGAKARGEMPQEFAIYFAGTCRDAQRGESRGEQDLLQAVSEGYEVGYKI